MKTTQSFCQPLEFLNFLSKYPERRLRAETWYSSREVVVERCQQTWTLLFVLCAETAEAAEEERFRESRVPVSERSRASSDPEIDFRDMNRLFSEELSSPSCWDLAA